MTQEKTHHDIGSWRLTACRNIVFKLLKMIQHEKLTIVEGKNKHTFGNVEASLTGTITVHHPRVYFDLLTSGDIGFGECYAQGFITSPDIVNVTRVLVRQQAMLKKLSKWTGLTGKMFGAVAHYLRRNSVTGSKKNIMAHYDLGNDFFEQFLDPTMMYSNALYTHANETLEVASENKLRRICEQLALGTDEDVMEIGTGWGGFAIYAAENYGCHVTTTTISEQQFVFATQRVKEKGLTDKVTVLKKDYRELEGTFDKVVSIEMIEAVGHPYLSTYLTKIDSLLKPNGQALIQAILMPDQKYDTARRQTDFIKTHIFPGGFLPSTKEILSQTQKYTKLNLINYLDITESYAWTLRDWRKRFDESEESIASLHNARYDETFRRLWRLYLAYCESGFEERAIFSAQLTFEKSGLLTA